MVVVCSVRLILCESSRIIGYIFLTSFKNYTLSFDQNKLSRILPSSLCRWLKKKITRRSIRNKEILFLDKKSDQENKETFLWTELRFFVLFFGHHKIFCVSQMMMRLKFITKEDEMIRTLYWSESDCQKYS